MPCVPEIGKAVLGIGTCGLSDVAMFMTDLIKGGKKDPQTLEEYLTEQALVTKAAEKYYAEKEAAAKLANEQKLTGEASNEQKLATEQKLTDEQKQYASALIALAKTNEGQPAGQLMNETPTGEAALKPYDSAMLALATARQLLEKK